VTVPKNLNNTQFALSSEIGHHAITAHINTEPIGRMTWAKATGKIAKVYVRPEHRRTGVATAMFHAAKDMAREQGLQEPSHSQSRSDAGEGWVQSLGEQAPARVSDREYYR
jgi:GNAT superfamily N-acetyltransferase